MTTLVLLLLGGIWAVVLIVPLVRARSEGSQSDSIGTFRRHLSVLERAAPTKVRPANRLREPINQSAMARSRPPASAGAHGGGSHGGRSKLGPLPSVQRRRQAQRRRRDVLFALLAGMAGSLLLGMVHGLRVMLVVHVVLDLLFLCYLGLLVRVRNLAAEREMKLTFLPTGATARMAGGRPAANVAYARAVGYDDGAEYGLPSGY